MRSNNKICFKLNYSFCCVVCFIFMKEIAFEKTIVLNDVNMISRTTFRNVSKIVLTSIEIWREKVRTTKITTSKTKKNSENSVDDQNVEMVFLVDQNVEKQIITTSKSKLSQRRKELITTTKITTSKRTSKVIKTTFNIVIILNAIGKIRTSKV